MNDIAVAISFLCNYLLTVTLCREPDREYLIFLTDNLRETVRGIISERYRCRTGRVPDGVKSERER